MWLHVAQHAFDAFEHTCPSTYPKACETPVITAIGRVIVLSEYTNFGLSRVLKVVLPPSMYVTVPPKGSVLEKVQLIPVRVV